MSDALPTSVIRLRLGAEDAHYGGNLVAGARQLEIIGDLITELAMRYDGDEGLFRAYESVEFLAPLYAGDWIEARAGWSRWTTSRRCEFEG
jgi:3-aminobutyryl-CoA ammonia-lyase